MKPPWLATMRLQVASPRPVPFFFDVKKGWKILPTCSDGIPGPSSVTSIITRESTGDLTLTHTFPFFLNGFEAVQNQIHEQLF